MINVKHYVNTAHGVDMNNFSYTRCYRGVRANKRSNCFFTYIHLRHFLLSFLVMHLYTLSVIYMYIIMVKGIGHHIPTK